MAFVIAFLLFLATMILCLIKGLSIIWAMTIGFLAFFSAACIHGSKAGAVLRASLHGIRETTGVMIILLLIGCLTAAWRVSGVIAFFVYYGISQITPPLFLLLAFVLTLIISYALGTSVGTAGTAGVILMAIAHSGGVNELLAAGSICAGLYFGDRVSPVASSANLMAELTHTDLYGNVKRMLKTSIIPVAFCTLIYAILSFQNPLHSIDSSILTAITTDFHISFWLIVPVFIMLILPLFKIDVRLTIAASTLSACVLAVTLQGKDILLVLRACILGYHPAASVLQNVWSGGGAFSMLEIIIVLLIASTYADIFKESGTLELLYNTVEKTMQKFGRTVTVILYSLISVGIFCSQLIASMMAVVLLEKPYRDRSISREDLALDLENSLIIFSDMIPWNMSCVAPLALLGVGPIVILYNYLLFAIPLFYFAGNALQRRKNIQFDKLAEAGVFISKAFK